MTMYLVLTALKDEKGDLVTDRQNIVAVCNQITLLCYAPVQVSDIFDLTVSFKLINFSFIYSFFLFLKCLLVLSYIA